MALSAEQGGGPSAGTRAPPYLGLASYGDTDEDAARFFGREAERDLVIANLRSATVTVLYGPSGVGKSSLLHAGVVHRLRATQAQPGVIVLDDWSRDPTAALTAGVAAVAGVHSDGGESDLTLSAALDALREQRTRALHIILDRFEDYLRLYSAGHGDEFAAALAMLLAPGHVRVRVLIALRQDRLAELDHLDGFLPARFGNVLRLEPLSPEQAREAIVGPLEFYNASRHAMQGNGAVTLEPGLVDMVLAELIDLSRRDPGRSSADGQGDGSADSIDPSFLSLTMRRIWDADVGAGACELRLSTLRSLGGAARIFDNHLSSTMNALSTSERRLAADVLHFLVTPSGAIQRWTALDLADYVHRSNAEVEALTEKLSRSPARILRSVETVHDGTTHVEYEPTHQVLARPILEWRRRYETVRLEHRLRRLLLSLAAVVAVALPLIGYAVQPGPLARLELGTVDARFAIRGAQSPDRDIVLVTIGADAYRKLLAPGAPPPRAVVAQALDEMAAARPLAIASDIVFTGSKTPAGDEALIAAIHRHAALVVLATDSLVAPSETSGSAGTPSRTVLFGRADQTFTDNTVPAAAWAGFPPDGNDSGVIRTMERAFGLPVSQVGGALEPMKTLALVASRVAGDGAAVRDAPAETWVDYRGGAGTFPAVAFDDVLTGRPAALAQLHGRIVVLGITAPAVGDSHDTSAPGRSVMSGTEVQANAISTAMRGFPLRDASHGIDVVLIVILGLLPLALVQWLGALRGVLCAVVVALVFCGAAQLLFDAGRVVNVVFPLVGVVLGTVIVLVVDIARRRASTSSAEPATASG